MKKSLRWLLRLIGPAILIYFLYNTDLSQIISLFGQLNWIPVIVSLVFYLPFVIVKSWRWNMIMTDLGMQAPPLGYSMVLYMIGLFIGGATPGQSGDFIKAWYLRERGQKIAPALFSILLDRLFDFLIMAILAVLGLISFAEYLPNEQRQAIIYGTIIFAILIIIALPALMLRGPRHWIVDQILRITPKKLQGFLIKLRTQFEPLNIKPVLLGKLLFATLLSASSTIFRLWMLFLALGIFVPILPMVAAMALTSIVQVLPITVGGIGVRELILVPLLEAYNYSQEQAITLSILFLLINIEHIIVGFFVSLRYPLGQQPPEDYSAELEATQE